MAKICTSIEQSKKLMELGIDINTADMDYVPFVNDPTEYDCVINEWNNEHEEDWIPAWSLSALLDILPSEFTEVGKYSTTTYEIKIRKYKFTDNVNLHQIAYGSYKFYEDDNSSWKDMINTGEKEDLLDAAFEMVCWLKENNKL